MKAARVSGPALLILLAMVLPGCSGSKGPKPVDVSGKITLDGKPLPNVTVAFSALDKDIPVERRYVTGVTDAEGNYNLKTVSQGEYVVQIQETGASAVDAANPDMAGAYPGNPKLAFYGSNSPLRAKVSDSAKTFDFTLPQAK